MKLKNGHIITGVVVILGLIFFVLGFHHLTKHPKYYAHSLRNYQEADSVAGYPLAQEGTEAGEERNFWTADFEPNLSSMKVLERYFLPTARAFARPTQPAEDLVRAAGDGLVLYAGSPEGTDHQLVLIGHRLPDGSIVQTFYGGLENLEVRTGEEVARTDRLGDHTGDFRFEVRAGTAIDLQPEVIEGISLNSPSSEKPPNRIDPEDLLAKYPPPDHPPVLKIMRDQERDEFPTMQIPEAILNGE